jgi:hypothetical protein
VILLNASKSTLKVGISKRKSDLTSNVPCLFSPQAINRFTNSPVWFRVI